MTSFSRPRTKLYSTLSAPINSTIGVSESSVSTDILKAPSPSTSAVTIALPVSSVKSICSEILSKSAFALSPVTLISSISE